MLFTKGAYPKAIANICSYLCLHDSLRNRVLCSSLMRGYNVNKKRLEKKFGRIYVVGLLIYVSSDKAIRPDNHHYFVCDKVYTNYHRVITKVDCILRIESLVFINHKQNDWSLSLLGSQGKIKSFKSDSLHPARLNYYMSKVILDSGKGLAVVAHESCANYFYYDSVEDRKDSRVYTKKMIVYDPIASSKANKPIKKEVTRVITCFFPENYEGIGKLTVNIPGTIRKMSAKQLAKMTFVADHKNGKAIMFEKFSLGNLFFLDSDCVEIINLADQYKKRNTKCKNM